MPSFRFIHCSDLHIDSPFKGLSAVKPGLADKLRRSTVLAFQNVVALAIKEHVEAVIIAGDVYDSEDKSLQAQLKFRDSLRDLEKEGIRVFISHGNHDPFDSWSASLGWPENVKIFSPKQVESFPVCRNGQVIAHVYGISFPRRDVKENLALLFKRRAHEGFAIGVLHANVGGRVDHDPYSPCSMEDLLASGMDYWALGHIHNHEVLRKSHPAIVYSGNTQARHRKEEGERGCCLVTLSGNAPPAIQFVPTDVVRYKSASLDISTCGTLDEVIELIHSTCGNMVANGCDVIIRLTLTGRTAVHSELTRAGYLEDLRAQCFFEQKIPMVSLDLVLETQGTYDMASLRQGNNFIADIITSYDQAEAHLEEIRENLKPLLQTWQGSRHLGSLTDERLQELLIKARNRTLDHLGI